jgi:small subunit ribosomal protein S16
MAVKLRLMRMGKKKQPTYRVVAADSRSPRDGRFIELIGRYDPKPDPSVVEIDNDRALDWLQKGAQPTPQVRKLLEISGAWARFKVVRGEIHTIDESPPPLPPAPKADPAPVAEIAAEVPEAPVDAAEAAAAPAEAVTEAVEEAAATEAVEEAAAEQIPVAEAEAAAADEPPAAAESEEDVS